MLRNKHKYRGRFCMLDGLNVAVLTLPIRTYREILLLAGGEREKWHDEFSYTVPTDWWLFDRRDGKDVASRCLIDRNWLVLLMHGLVRSRGYCSLCGYCVACALLSSQSFSTPLTEYIRGRIWVRIVTYIYQRIECFIRTNKSDCDRPTDSTAATRLNFTRPMCRRNTELCSDVSSM